MTVSVIFAAGSLGLVAGLMIGCAGIGGVILVPALTYLAGIPIRLSIAAAMMAYIPAGALSTAVYAREGSISWPMALWLAAGAMPGAWLGARASAIAPPFVIEAAIAVVTLGSGCYALMTRAADGQGRVRLAPPVLAGIGVVTGLLSAMTGTGGPLVLIPILVSLRLPLLMSVGLSQAIQTPIAILATAGNVSQGTADYVLAACLAVGLTAGSWAGARLAHRLPGPMLKRIIAVILIGTGVLVTAKVLSALVA